ncbi:MFS transporter [Brachybacterium squillarum]|uniref:MFS transporter n=1 Tax=Brachybacterium squillarum TaxID=661979 RepID=UPI00222306A7|nr:MFS transporter [Brachybacterium squillarum]MCW1805485.1 MFS transporter [Brachybacterium squillarum]
MSASSPSSPASPTAPSAPPKTLDAPLRRARVAVAALFLTNGALLANLLPRYPEIKAALGLANSTYGLTLAAFPAGAILAGLAAAGLIRRLGSARLAVLGTALTALGLLLAAWAPSAALLGLALLVAGGCDAITDVAQNAHGLRVQRRYGRTIINSFHAVWSVGAVIGGSMAAAAIALGIPLRWHLLGSGILFAIVALVALRFTLPGHDEEDHLPDPAAGDAAVGPDSPTDVRTSGRLPLVLAALVLIAIGGTLVEDSGNSWATLYLSRDLGAASSIAAIGYIALVGAQFVGRLLADGLVDRLGQRAVARGGGAIIALGMGAALAVPTVPGTIVGFALAGLGSASLVPAAMQQADDLPGLRPGTGLTVVSWLMRLGFLASPPLVGLVADSAGLRTGLLVVPLAGLLVALLAGVLPPRRAAHPERERELSAAG